MNFINSKKLEVHDHPELAYSIYLAFDEGEYHHDGDDINLDTPDKYTKPIILEILESQNFKF